MVYDIFISYRREGGYETAKHINDLLVRDGYSVSFDIDTLREGDFDKALLKRVVECVDFLLIVDKQCFDKTISGSCKPDQDWLRQEVAYALKLKKNIVTVLLAGAKFPDNLPNDISEVAKKNGPEYSKGYFDTFYEKLKNGFLHSHPRNSEKKESGIGDTRSAACLKLRTDFECLFYLDGEEKMRLESGKIQKIPLREGEYELKFVSVDNEADVVTTDFVMPAVDKLYNVNRSSFGGHEYVDLGLPSGTLWATCNVGASKPEDYGDYYAWGETKKKDVYDEDTYKHAQGAINKLTKYCNESAYGYNGFADTLTELQPIDDPATANWGNGWYTPKKEQWDELMANTNSEWTTQNGVEGRLFMAKNGQTLFLPAAGDSYSELELLFYDAGSYGCYWSGSLVTDDPSRAWYLGLFSDDCGMNYYGDRYIGRSVRAVREN